MIKKTVMVSLAAASLLSTSAMAASAEDRIAKLEKELEKIKTERLTELNARTAGNHLKFDVDYRFSVDNVKYTTLSGNTYGNSDLYRSRLWLNMGYKYNDNLSFTGQLAYHKTFGQRFVMPNNSNYGQFETFDWVVNEMAYDDLVRVRTAYFFLQDDELFGADIPWTFSIGRRPSTNGYLAHFRENDNPASPMAHVVNVEFDGASAKFGLEGLTSVPGAYLKFCYGRGATNANYGMGTPTPNTTVPMGKDNLGDIDMGGFIFVPYDDGQYSVHTLYSYANDLIDASYDVNGTFQGMYTTGDLHLATASFTANGIGDGWSDFTDDTIFFVSGAWTRTAPQNDTAMLDPWSGGNGTGMNHALYGSSVWTGLILPLGISDGSRIGFEYNRGSQFFRPVTYGEDTITGSKVATRGQAFEVYWNENLVDDALTFQLRYTDMMYEYTGSQGFFGTNTGVAMETGEAAVFAAMGMMSSEQVVTRAQNLRAYLRYRF